jgi:hypothetical protein
MPRGTNQVREALPARTSGTTSAPPAACPDHRPYGSPRSRSTPAPQSTRSTREPSTCMRGTSSSPGSRSNTRLNPSAQLIPCPRQARKGPRPLRARKGPRPLQARTGPLLRGAGRKAGGTPRGCNAFSFVRAPQPSPKAAAGPVPSPPHVPGLVTGPVCSPLFRACFRDQESRNRASGLPATSDRSRAPGLPTTSDRSRAIGHPRDARPGS